MESFTQVWNTLMALSVFGGIIAILTLLYTLALPQDALSKKISAFTGKHILVLGFLISLAAMVSSLVYSDVIGYPPCLFCWYARVAFYPQVFMYGLALYRKDFKILDYSLLLTVLGTIVTAYHYTAETIQYSPLPCAAAGVSCLTRYVYEYGFITIPIIGLVGFLTLLMCTLVARRALKNAAV
jgi:disulfide bond formation protein DsbB